MTDDVHITILCLRGGYTGLMGSISWFVCNRVRYRTTTDGNDTQYICYIVVSVS